MLEVKDLHVSYGHVPAVRGVSLSAERGRITLVLGTNGAGKSTTLRAIAGLQKPDSGSVLLEGKQVLGLPAHKMVRRGVVLVPEGRRVFAPLTVMENLRMGGYTSPASFKRRIAEVWEMFPILYERREGAAGLLSGGEQQMLAFARALMSDPSVVLLDEPSMGLAPAVLDVILASVRSMADAGLAVVMVEQNAQAGMEVADELVAVARGEVVFTGQANDAAAKSSVIQAFLGDAALVETTS
jgi:branched-chain amino acid transport system ATP-binding protein